MKLIYYPDTRTTTDFYCSYKVPGASYWILLNFDATWSAYNKPRYRTNIYAHTFTWWLKHVSCVDISRSRGLVSFFNKGLIQLIQTEQTSADDVTHLAYFLHFVLLLKVLRMSNNSLKNIEILIDNICKIRWVKVLYETNAKLDMYWQTI